jgi:ABC-2 type transport system ATP-binding protein
MITAENLRKRYDDVTAVDGISFEISPGEVFGLLGPNGAGKTTTLNMLVGALKPDAGNIAINGVADPTRPEVRREIGYAPQALAIYDKLTAVENLAFFGKLYGLSGRQLKERVDWALDFVGLRDRQKGSAGTFSGGMKRRLNLAAAVIHDPPVLFLDEPTVGVDPQSRNLIFDSIEDLKRQGKTIIYTTHYMEEAQRLCHRVAIMDHGKILALDAVDTLIREHGGASVIEAELEQVPGDTTKLPGTLDGRRLRIVTARPLEELAGLSRFSLQLAELRIDRPNLETVFLNLTGRSLRD